METFKAARATLPKLAQSLGDVINHADCPAWDKERLTLAYQTIIDAYLFTRYVDPAYKTP